MPEDRTQMLRVLKEKRIIKLLVLLMAVLVAVSFFSACEKKKEAAFVIIEPADEEETVATKSASEMSYYMTGFADGSEPQVENQGDLGACWAFAATGAMEYALAKEATYNFSEDHMIFNNGYGLDVKDGGDYVMTMAYLASWKGPVLDEEDPYGDGKTKSNATCVKHVQEIQIIEDKNYDLIKEMIYKYGAVESSIYISLTDDNNLDMTYYNATKCSYCYTDGNTPNHEIVIIGWDDEYSKDNFNTGAEEDGAFICQNSWGSDFGNNGIFYVSYSDSVIGTLNEVYTGIEEPDNYDNIYQYDECGWIGRGGFNESHAYFTNVFTSLSSQSVEAVGFYATERNTSYKIYVCDNFRRPSSLKVDGKVYAEGKLENPGYYTIKLNEPPVIKSGRKFAVIVEIDTPGVTHPIAVEMNANDGRTNAVTIDGKESYISSAGKDWERTQNSSQCNVCLKVFTNEH